MSINFPAVLMRCSNSCGYHN